MKHKRIVLVKALYLLSSVAWASTWNVNGVSGSDSNNCTSATTACKTIKHAISLASSGDSIRVAAATYTENLTIGFSLKVIGSGAPTTIIDGGGAGTVVTISNTSAHVTLSQVTIRNGRAPFGGGINNSGNLSINRTVIAGNSANGTVNGFGYGSAGGGGIYNFATLTINNSTISGNRAGVSGCSKANDHCSARGGAILSGGTVMIDNSTISGNEVGFPCFEASCTDIGGGISSGGTLIIASSTLSGNEVGCVANGRGGTCFLGPGGIDNSHAATIQNSIVANNSSNLASANCRGTVTSNGYNLSSDTTCNFSGPSDMNNIDPMLGPLQNNGGPTQTMALLPGSPAIDAGNPSGCRDGNGYLLKTDQRGMPRPDTEDKTGCDMGAYERESD